MEFHVEDNPDPLDIEVLETQIRREASAAMGLGDEVELAIFVRDAGKVLAGMVKRITPDIPVTSVVTMDDIEALAKTL